VPEFELALDGAAFGGRMVGRHEGRVVFVQGSMPGEVVRAEVTAVRKRFAEATATTVVQPQAELRAAPPCPYFGENGRRRGALPPAGTPGERSEGVCGGCQYQHIAYAGQLAAKRGIVADVLRRIGRLGEVEVGETVPSPSPWAYRTKARWSVDAAGRVGYRRAESSDPLAVASCHIVAPPLAEVLARLAAPDLSARLAERVVEITARCAGASADGAAAVVLVLHASPAPPDEDDPAGSVVDGAAEEALLAEEAPPGELDSAGLIAPLEEPHPLADLAAALGETLGLRGVAAAPEAPGRQAQALWGDAMVETEFAGLRFRLQPLTFFQVNAGGALELLREVRAGLGPLRGQTVLDVYSGAGAFALALGGEAAEVFAIESDRGAVADARASAALNGVSNVHVIAGDAELALRDLALGLVDVAVVDPPRAGCARGVLAELGRLQLSRLVYVSCDPATLARDLALLGEQGYRTLRVLPVDLFPQTASIEAVAVLGPISAG
jgi:23S rRNA (uracil1939-C5)-methyltransferase